ncbi:hypothetical protein CPB84DRAFT_1020480 [Gymnopilus junonius]|uniref:Uncharacterized protein n=1 Tax=Gymnopilus junonius TaxID=109634 RepID=A0A9P5TNX3_GYMJU|nr:hypothetical protein CPB84DRAFT_1020480 [Gymnopilus junonius]
MSAASLDSYPLPSKAHKAKLDFSEEYLTSSLHVANDLPCPADKDLDELPRPRYTPHDIHRVQRTLLHFVPAELADAILDMAEFWPYASVSRNSYTSACSALEAPDGNAQWCFLVSPKVPAIERNGARLPTIVKKVDFSIKTYESSFGKTDTSNDTKGASPDVIKFRKVNNLFKHVGVSQGYKTWFESSILKNGQHGEVSYGSSSSPNHWYASTAGPHPKYLNDFGDVEYPGSPADSPLDRLQRWHVRNNPQSSSDREWHQVTWRQGDPTQAADVDCVSGEGSGAGFVDSLAVDDQILLMARAMSPGWINLVFNVKIDIYYAFASSYL